MLWILSILRQATVVDKQGSTGYLQHTHKINIPKDCIWTRKKNTKEKTHTETPAQIFVLHIHIFCLWNGRIPIEKLHIRKKKIKMILNNRIRWQGISKPVMTILAKVYKINELSIHNTTKDQRWYTRKHFIPS